MAKIVPTIQVGTGNQIKVVEPVFLTGIGPDGQPKALVVDVNGAIAVTGGAGGGGGGGSIIATSPQSVRLSNGTVFQNAALEDGNLASILAKLPTVGTAGTPSANFVSVQGNSSMTPLLVSGSSAVGATVNGFGNMVGGSDGTNFRYLSVDTGGRSNVNIGAGSDIITVSGNITAQNLVPAGVATANSAVEITVGNSTTVAVQVTGSYAVSALTLQSTIDGTTWVTVGGTPFLNTNTGTSLATITAALTSVFQIEVAGFNRVRITALGAITGTATVSLRGVFGSALFAMDSALPAGSAIIGALTANQTVNASQINGIAPLMGNGVTGTGSLRVTLASDTTANSNPFLFAGAAAAGGVTTSNPVRIGVVAKTAIPTARTDAQAVDLIATTAGVQVTKQFSTPELEYAAVDSITATTTAVQVKNVTAAAKNYVTGLTIATATLGAVGEIQVRSTPTASASATIASNTLVLTATFNFKVGDLVYITASTVTGLTAGTYVYILTVATSNLTFSATRGGSVLAISGTAVSATISKILWRTTLQTTALPLTYVPFPSPPDGGTGLAIEVCTPVSLTSGRIDFNVYGYTSL